MAFLPFSIGIVVGAVVASKTLPKVGPRLLVSSGLALGSAGLLSFVVIGPHTSWTTHVLPGEIAVAIGMGITFVVLASLALVGVGARDTGVASAVLNTSQQVGGALGVALLSTLYASSWHSYLSGHHQQPLDTPGGPQPTLPAALHGYHVAFTAAAVVLAAASLLAVTLISAHREDLPADTMV